MYMDFTCWWIVLSTVTELCSLHVLSCFRIALTAVVKFIDNFIFVGWSWLSCVISLLIREACNGLSVGVGDCLAVACAVTLWGCSLPANLLRRLIYVTLVEFGSSRYLDRWRRQQCADGGTDISFQVRLAQCLCWLNCCGLVTFSIYASIFRFRGHL